MRELFKFLLALLAAQNNLAAVVNVECLSNCIINTEAKTINGELDKDIVLRYNIESSFDIVSLQYAGLPLAVATKAIFLSFPNPHEFDFGERKIVKADGTYSFELTLKKVNIDTQDQKEVSLNIAHDGDQMLTITLTTVIHDGPYFLGSWQSSITLEEGAKKDISFIVYGKPTPSVSAHIGDGQLRVNSSFLRDLTYEYTSNIIAERKYCGKNITVKAVGFKQPSLTSTLTVSFDPLPPDEVYAYLSNGHCLTVSWSEIQSGNCPVTYTLQYNGTKELENKTQSTVYKECNSEMFDENTVISVRAEVDGRRSTYSNAVKVILIETPGKGEVRGSDYGRWDLYLLVSMSIIVVIGIFVWILILIANRKQNESSALKNSNEDLLSTSSNDDVQKDRWLVLDLSEEQGLSDDQIVMAKVLKEM